MSQASEQTLKKKGARYCQVINLILPNCFYNCKEHVRTKLTSK